MTLQHEPSVTRTPVPGGWAEEQVRVGRICVDLVRPAEPDAFLEQIVDDAGDAEQDPYWAQLWPTSRQMAQFVLERDWPAGMRTLELGCGLGLVGIAALARGLAVTFSDLHQLAVETAIENARRNGFTNARGLLLDWRRPKQEHFPMIIAADILYDSQLHTPLLDCIDAMLGPNGACYLGDPGRSAAEAFADAARKRGIHVIVLDQHGNELLEATSNTFGVLRLQRG